MAGTSVFQALHSPVPFSSRHNAPTKHRMSAHVAHRSVSCDARQQPHEQSMLSRGGGMLLSLAAAALIAASPAQAEGRGGGPRLPPIDRDPNRCQRAYTGNTIGQANAVSDKVLDLRMCDFSGKDLSGKTLSGALLENAKLPNSNLREAIFSKAYAVGADFSGADMTNSVVDRVDFSRADLSKVKFINAVITGAFFDGANLDGATFEDALIGGEDVKRLCSNVTLTGESRESVGCRYKLK